MSTYRGASNKKNRTAEASWRENNQNPNYTKSRLGRNASGIWGDLSSPGSLFKVAWFRFEKSLSTCWVDCLWAKHFRVFEGEELRREGRNERESESLSWCLGKETLKGGGAFLRGIWRRGSWGQNAIFSVKSIEFLVSYCLCCCCRVEMKAWDCAEVLHISYAPDVGPPFFLYLLYKPCLLFKLLFSPSVFLFLAKEK